MENKILLDTQTFLWYVEDNAKLPSDIKRFIEDNFVVVSIASLWEITIKMTIGKLVLSKTIKELLASVDLYGFEIISVKPKHLLVLSELPQIHRDPFDRIIISQKISEDFILVSSDSTFKLYELINLISI